MVDRLDGVDGWYSRSDGGLGLMERENEGGLHHTTRVSLCLHGHAMHRRTRRAVVTLGPADDDAFRFCNHRPRRTLEALVFPFILPFFFFHRPFSPANPRSSLSSCQSLYAHHTLDTHCIRTLFERDSVSSCSHAGCAACAAWRRKPAAKPTLTNQPSKSHLYCGPVAL